MLDVLVVTRFLTHVTATLLQISAIDKLLSAFIIPLQSDDISTTDAEGRHRIHCSLNINTETGRLSARRPNLQNQPALEKDRYKVKQLPQNQYLRLLKVWGLFTAAFAVS
jgi:DNA polymerase I-like protein with 3'-5' exonuclease and polymerase domains